MQVWDLHESPTAVNTIQTIASVGRVKWRPNTKYHIARWELNLFLCMLRWVWISSPYLSCFPDATSSDYFYILTTTDLTILNYTLIERLFIIFIALAPMTNIKHY